MSARKNKIKMSFICNQNWDEMSPSMNGRCCEFCKQKVLDFSRYSNKELELLGKSKAGICGRFTIEQIDSALIKPIEFSRLVKILSFLSALYFSICTGKSYGQNIDNKFSEKIEWVDEIKDNDSLSNCNTVSVSTKKSVKVENKKRLVLSTKRKRIYLTRRFPFVKVVRIFHVMGKFRL